MARFSESVRDENADRVLKHIEREEIAQLALEMSQIDSPVGYEGEVLQYIYDWLDREGFSPRKVGMLENRYNIVGTLKGTGQGYTLLTNSHTDTTLSRDDTWIQPNLDDPVWHTAWREGDILTGYGICNDKGPLASTMVAAKALKQSGIRLKGDLLVTAVCSEISRDPVDEYQPPHYHSREVGAEYLVSHGVVADFALVAEATAHGYSRVLSGVAGFKITVILEGAYAYIPLMKRPTTIQESPNAIVRMAKVIEAFEEWAYQFQQEHQTEFEGATVIPKAAIVGIRGGDPTTVGSITGVCSLYVKAFIPPGFNPLTIVRELKEATVRAGIDVDIQPYAYRPGFEGKNTEVLTDAIERAHQSIFNEKIQPIKPAVPSMWRDCNVFNAFNIPSVTYGPGSVDVSGKLEKGGAFSLHLDELYNFSKSYALVALDICSQERR